MLQITVGSPSRANTIASFLDETPKPFILSSERGFLTITGRFKGTPISIVSIGMGSPNMDFFVREIRECIGGDLVIVRFLNLSFSFSCIYDLREACTSRLGSCGALIDVPVGTVVVPKASVAITRNVDFDFVNPENGVESAYHISKPVGTSY